MGDPFVVAQILAISYSRWICLSKTSPANGTIGGYIQIVSRFFMKSVVSFAQFDALELRVGQILTASAPEWSKKLLRFEVDFGEQLGKRIVFSGIKQWYSPQDLVGKSYPFILNLEPKKMGEEESQGMMLMADGQDHPVLFALGEVVQPGTIIR